MTAKKNKTTPDKRRKYDDAFKAEALRLASESRSTQAAAQPLGISPKLLYRWQQAQLVAEVGSVEGGRTIVGTENNVRETQPAVPASWPGCGAAAVHRLPRVRAG